MHLLCSHSVWHNVVSCSRGTYLPTERLTNYSTKPSKQPSSRRLSDAHAPIFLYILPTCECMAALAHRCSGLSLLGSPISPPMAACVAWKACQHSTNTSALKHHCKGSPATLPRTVGITLQRRMPTHQSTCISSQLASAWQL